MLFELGEKIIHFRLTFREEVNVVEVTSEFRRDVQAWRIDCFHCIRRRIDKNRAHPLFDPNPFVQRARHLVYFPIAEASPAIS